MYNIVFIIIVGILIFDFLFEQFLEYLNAKNRNLLLPEVLKNIYPQDKYQESIKYDKANYRFSIINSSFDFILILLFLFISGFAVIDQFARLYSSNPIIIALLFFGIILFASDIIHIPFSIYDTFVIEEKFGFNKTTLKTFILDKIKGWILMVVIGGGLLALIVWFYYYTHELFWIYAWILAVSFMFIMILFYTSLIVPLFNKLKPLEEGDLKSTIQEFCNQVNFQLKDVYIIDGSKRSTKANAFFSGLGKKKKIVLYDTLIEKLSKEEIVAVLAHEIGHYKKKHTLISFINSTIQTGITLYILSLFIGIPEFSKVLGSDIHSFHLGLVTFGFLYSPISTVVGLFSNMFSRYNEYEADKYAFINYEGKHLINALIKLSATNLSNLTPHPFYVFVNYSHPTLLQRIKNIEKFNKTPE
ncbi:MAG: peptidase M48 [Bacteroidetes bacterium GWC2_33_15]|nr:MAG: peptidase M48 [Bacteroidetes bacterium GWA2_33_15]OFX50629.1 MAG: peptidase M48 [Bacteroidetes bacterium GWC2_33_15]OFX64166.1 MAG: peptidase M48 [Bacteroidetes bacterium GWB2_32_14]OFX69778.1 MAG: peptidase M48 [Bacteroidetes bacterium GWD2_33_33]HAN19817.1 peptidase M48 [Bacteroidales bacterium]